MKTIFWVLYLIPRQSKCGSNGDEKKTGSWCNDRKKEISPYPNIRGMTEIILLNLDCDESKERDQNKVPENGQHFVDVLQGWRFGQNILQVLRQGKADKWECQWVEGWYN